MEICSSKHHTCYLLFHTYLIHQHGLLPSLNTCHNCNMFQIFVWFYPKIKTRIYWSNLHSHHFFHSHTFFYVFFLLTQIFLQNQYHCFTSRVASALIHSSNKDLFHLWSSIWLWDQAYCFNGRNTVYLSMFLVVCFLDQKYFNRWYIEEIEKFYVFLIYCCPYFYRL